MLKHIPPNSKNSIKNQKVHEEYAMLLSETRSKIKKFASNWNNRILKTFTSAKFWIAGASCVRF